MNDHGDDRRVMCLETDPGLSAIEQATTTGCFSRETTREYMEERQFRIMKSVSRNRVTRAHFQAREGEICLSPAQV
jgi:hypothetical protein